MRNAPFYLLLGVVAIIVGLLVIGVFLTVTEGGAPENVLGAVCTIAILVVAVIGYEVMMKPDLYLRRKPKEENEDTEADEKGESPKA